MENRYYQVGDGVIFERQPSGAVRAMYTHNGRPPSEGGNILFERTFDEGVWCSIVLTMSAHSERPGDWHQWIEHHSGRKDLLNQNAPPLTLSAEMMAALRRQCATCGRNYGSHAPDAKFPDSGMLCPDQSAAYLLGDARFVNRFKEIA